MLTIVLPFRNREKDKLERCLYTLTKQINNYPIVLVDYGSDESSKAVLKELSSRYLFQLITVAADKWKKTHASNIGLRSVSTKYVLFSDVDMIYAPNFTKVIVEELDKGQRIVTCNCFYLSKEETAKLIMPIDWRNYRPSIYQTSGETAVGACLAMTTAWVKDVGGFDEQYLGWGREDYDLLCRAKLAGLTHTWITSSTTFYHQWHERSDWKMDEDAVRKNVRHFDEFTTEKQLISRNPNGWGIV